MGTFGSLAKAVAKTPAFKMAVGGAVLGGVGGAVWDYDSRAGTGAMVGAAAGLGLMARGKGLGILRSGSASFREGAMRALPGIVGGGAIGALTGPTDSTLANIGLGAIAGGGGSALGARFGGGFASKYKHNRMAIGKMGIKHGYAGTMPGGKVYAGVRLNSGRKIGMPAMSTKTIGATASALFAPHAAHALIGSSRKEKQQNSLNRY